MTKRQKLLAAFFIAALIFAAIVSAETEERIHDLEEGILDLKDEGEEKDRVIDSLQSELDTLHTINWDNIAYWLDHFGVEHEDVVLQQIALETGGLTSTICIEQNNLFGMKHPRIRPTTSLGNKRNHAYYANYVESIKDYTLWQRYSYTGGGYYAFLVRAGYAEATHYVSALKRL